MSAAPPVVLVSVAPTSTVVVPEVDVRDRTLVTVQVVNLDGAQTFDGTIWSKQEPSLPWSPSTLGDLTGIPPTSSAPDNVRTVDIDVTGRGWLLVTGKMSGAGGNVNVCTRLGGRDVK